MLKHPKIVIAAVILLTLVFGIIAVTVVFDNDLMIFFPEDNPSYVRNEAVEEQYGSQVMMDICITTEEETLLTWENLDMIETITAAIEDMNYVENVTSLTNTDYPEGTDEGMAVSMLLPEGQERTTENLELFKERLLDWSDAYRKAIYSDDYRSTQLLVRIDKDAGSDEIAILLDEVKALVAPYDQEPLQFRIAGDPVVTQLGKEYMYADLKILIPFVAIVLFLCLYFAFGRFSSALLPLITVLVATVWTVGTMSLFGVTFTIISSCLPVLIIAVGSAYGIHVINHYYHIKNEKKNGDIAGNLKEALKEVFVPILLAGVTTVIGFLSILTSPIVPMKSFGLFAAVGTVYSLILSFFFIPVLLEVAENRKHKNTNAAIEEDEYSKSEAFLMITSLSVKHKVPTILVILMLAGLSVWGVTKINIESSLIGYFPYNEPIRQDSRFISDNFGGTNTFNAVFQAEEGYDMTDPAVLESMDKLKNYLLEEYPEVVGHVISYSDFIKRMNQIMNYPAVEDSSVAESYDDDFAVEDDSFFGADDGFGDSFFGTDDSSDSFGDSFFGSDDGFGDIFADSAVEEAPAGEVTAEFFPLDEEVSMEELILLIAGSFSASDNAELSVADLQEKLRELTNYKGAAYYEIPSDLSKYPVNDEEELKNLIAQYLLLYSGSLDEYANDALKPTEARMMIQLKTHGSAETDAIIKDIDKYMSRNLPEGYSISYAGIAELELALTNLIMKSQTSSILFALLAVFIIIMITYKSPLAGFIGIIPLSLSILMNFGLMSIMEINLDMVTAIIASLAIGIGVDYTVHFLARYKKERLESDDLVQVTRNTVLSTGRGIVINALSVGLGFGVLCFSRFLVLRYIGILVAIIMVTSSLGALILLPLVLNKLDPKFMRKDEDGSVRNKSKRKSA
ncbi:MAG: MMPL family transporter [Spirochaetales bacterium]|nr:MMPL family transporter [Spirochaetales bacterium]